MNKVKAIVATLAVLLTVTACGVTPEATSMEQKILSKNATEYTETTILDSRGMLGLDMQGREGFKGWYLYSGVLIDCVTYSDSLTMETVQPLLLGEVSYENKIQCSGEPDTEVYVIYYFNKK